MYNENTNIINRVPHRSKDLSCGSKQSSNNSSYSKHLSIHRKIRQLKKFEERKLYQCIVKNKNQSSHKQKLKQKLKTFRQDIDLTKSIISSKNEYNLCQNRQKAIFNAFYDQQEIQESIRLKTQLLFRVRNKISLINSHRQGSLSGRSHRDKSQRSQPDARIQQRSDISRQNQMIKSVLLKRQKKSQISKIYRNRRSASQYGLQTKMENQFYLQTAQSRNIEKSVVSSVTLSIQKQQDLLNKKNTDISQKKSRISCHQVKIINSGCLTSQKKKRNIADFIRFKKDRMNFKVMR